MERNNNFEYLIVVTLVVVVAILSLVFMTQLNYMADNNNNQGNAVGYIIGNENDIGKTFGTGNSKNVAIIEVPEGYAPESTTTESTARK